MTLFEERERAFEWLFAHDEQMRFLAQARRNAFFGRWAAEHLGLSGEEADRYVRSFSAAVIEPGCEAHLVEKVRDDCATRGVSVSDDAIHRAWERAMVLVLSQELRAQAVETGAPVSAH